MIEPSQAYTVLRRACLPPKDKRTPQERVAAYQAPIIANLGRMPSIWEDAKRIRKRHGDPQKESKPVAESLTAKQARYRAIQAAKTQETRQTILDALARPSTAGDVATRIKRDEHQIRRNLVIMAGLGLVEGHKCKNVVVWHRKGEAA
jgi:ABC-type branched-subunit amino acid transport system substrate-binding protein